MSTNELGPLIEALAKAKATIKAPKKGRTANAGKFSYSYADRADVIESYQQALAENGLALIHSISVDEAMHTVLRSRLMHSSGACIESSYPIPNVEDAQTLGSWLTYLERYASCALLDIAAEDDDDGARAKKPARNLEAEAGPPVDPATLAFFDLRVAIRDAAEELAQKGGGLPDALVKEASGFQGDKGHAEFADPFDPKVKSQKWLKATLSRLTAKLTAEEPGAAEAADLFT